MWRVLLKDVYNFDETGFMIEIAARSNFITNTDRIGRAAVLQPFNQEGVTVIKCVSASSCCLPLFVILSGKLHGAI